MTHFKRIAIYVRTSTIDQNTELQKRELQEYLKLRPDWLLVKIYEDHASGTNGQRLQLQELLKDCRHRKVDVVLCWKLDRFFRSLKMLLNTLQELDEIGVKFISLKDQIDFTTSAGRLMFHMIGAFGEFEAALIKERVNAGIANAKAKGKVFGRPKNRDDRKIIEFRATGMSISKIAKALNISTGSVQAALAAKIDHIKTPFKINE